MIACNLTANNYLAPPLGFPFRLSVGNDTAIAFVPRGATVQAIVAPEYIADVHMALFGAPKDTVRPDGALLPGTQVGGLAASSSAPVTLTVSVPLGTVPNLDYAKDFVIVKLWYDNALDGKPDTVLRDSSIVDSTKQPKIPFGVLVTSFLVT